VKHDAFSADPFYANLPGQRGLRREARGQWDDRVGDAVRNAVIQAANRATAVNHAEGLSALVDADTLQSPTIREFALNRRIRRELGHFQHKVEVEHTCAAEVGGAIGMVQIQRMVAVVEQP
jgi:hypothetical protein